MADDDSDLKETEVMINGIPHTMLLSEEDAQRYADAESSSEDGDSVDSKAKTPANKSKTTTASK